MTTAVGRPAVFLDRDGVINVDRPDFVKRWEEFVPLEGAYDAIRRLTDAGYEVIVVTNQSCIGRGLVTAGTVEEIHRRMEADVRAAGGRLAAILVCPHAPGAGCSCRKPAPGLLERAIREHGIDPASSFLVGDSPRDVAAACAAGLRAFVVGGPTLEGAPRDSAARVVRSLAEAADALIARAGGRPPSAAGVAR